jgi:hypothetical protein
MNLCMHMGCACRLLSRLLESAALHTHGLCTTDPCLAHIAGASTRPSALQHAAHAASRSGVCAVTRQATLQAVAKVRPCSALLHHPEHTAHPSACAAAGRLGGCCLGPVSTPTTPPRQLHQHQTHAQRIILCLCSDPLVCALEQLVGYLCSCCCATLRCSRARLAAGLHIWYILRHVHLWLLLLIMHACF